MYIREFPMYFSIYCNIQGWEMYFTTDYKMHALKVICNVFIEIRVSFVT